MTAPLLMVHNAPEAPCCCLGPSTPAREMHCPACHASNGHNARWLFLMIDPNGTTRVYDHQEEAEEIGAALGGVVTALTLLSDYRTPHPEHPAAVGRAQPVSVPPVPDPAEQPEPAGPGALVRPYVESGESYPDPGPTDQQDEPEYERDGYPLGDRHQDAGAWDYTRETD